MDACYKSAQSKKWESVELIDWRGADRTSAKETFAEFDELYFLMKREKMADGSIRLMLREKSTGNIIQKII
jgi:hypothetical protein